MGLKIGDKVLVEGHWNKSIQTVTRITPKGNIRLSNGSLYDARGSEKTSDVWNSTTMVPLTPELEDQIHKEMVIDKAIRVMHDVRTLTYDKAIAIMEILDSE